ncbi:hypothetical protein SBOR_8396 [Sclerotinia borealis F-4128]|uniref:Uncharacterized protein n=1 Tax=Sclerotinia borealis (strain F-4128) TaxID=1432307 RepID=W9C354_SCLBF|nr:hypothetical protein SBOR_8396 [Sclerotinia borealis F-4128]
MHSIQFLTFFGVASMALALPAPQSDISQLTRREDITTHDGLVVSITDDSGNDQKRDTYKTHDGLSVTIEDDTSSDQKRDTLINAQILTTRDNLTVTISDINSDIPPEISRKGVGSSLLDKRNSDYVSSCGSEWTPISDHYDSHYALYWGYSSAVTAFCFSISADQDGNPFTIGPGKKLSLTRTYQFEAGPDHGARIGLKNEVPGHIEFEIHNKYSDANHTPDITTCEAYLLKMTDPKANGKNCYGSNNKDTKGGTWQVGSTKRTISPTQIHPTTPRNFSHKPIKMAETILTFCTAEISPEIISHFIRLSQRTEESSKIWSIVRTPTETPLGKRTRTNISPFQSGFLNSSQSTLTTFVRSAPQTDPYYFSRNTFAVLDARSIEDQTVVLWTYLESMPAELAEIGEWDEEKKIVEWRDFRVEFSKACWVVGLLEEKPQLFIEGVERKEGAYVDEDGILRVDAPMKEWDLEDNEE